MVENCLLIKQTQESISRISSVSMEMLLVLSNQRERRTGRLVGEITATIENSPVQQSKLLLRGIGGKDC